jgi:hypothetical protein
MFPPVSLQYPRQYQGDIARGEEPVESVNLPVKTSYSYSSSMNLRKKAQETLEDMSDASRQVVDSSQWATVALVAVAAVSVLALAVGIAALTTARREPARA